jgi:L-fuconate dehydratase
MVGWLNYSDDEVQAICTRALEQGFRAVKIKIGYPTLEEDAQRIVVVRRAIGTQAALMVDANQARGHNERVDVRVAREPAGPGIKPSPKPRDPAALGEARQQVLHVVRTDADLA